MKILTKSIILTLIFVSPFLLQAQTSFIQLSEKVISQATRKEAWGYFQFPVLNNSGRDLIVSWSMNPDNLSTLGKGNTVRMKSSDMGKNWETVNSNEVKDGVVLSNGCRLKLFTKPSVKYSPNTQRAKRSVGGELVNSYSRKAVRFYYDKDLPSEYQGAYLAKDCGSGFKPMKVKINDSDFIRYSENGVLPFIWWGNIIYDKSTNKLYAGMAPGYYMENGIVQPSGVIFYQSSDNGASWNKVGTIKYITDGNKDAMAKRRNISDGFTEPAFSILRNGTFVCVMRSSNGLGNRPLYLSRSTDKGKTWSKPKAITKSGVMPKLIQLDGGGLVLSTGRPGIQLYYSGDNGSTWSIAYSVLSNNKETCGYTGLQNLGNNQFMVVYSDFSRKNASGQERKAIVSKIFTVKK